MLCSKCWWTISILLLLSAAFKSIFVLRWDTTMTIIIIYYYYGFQRPTTTALSSSSSFFSEAFSFSYHSSLSHKQQQFHNRNKLSLVIRKEDEKIRNVYYQSSSSLILLSNNVEYLPKISRKQQQIKNKNYNNNICQQQKKRRHDVSILLNSIHSVEEYSVSIRTLTSRTTNRTTNNTDHNNNFDHHHHHIAKTSEVIIDMREPSKLLEVVGGHDGHDDHDYLTDNHNQVNTRSSSSSFVFVVEEEFKQRHQQQNDIVVGNKKAVVAKIEEVNNQNITYRNGLLIIGFITLLFASNSPVIHAAYSEISSTSTTTTTTIPVLLLNASCSIIAMITMIFANIFFSNKNTSCIDDDNNNNNNNDNNNNNSIINIATNKNTNMNNENQYSTIAELDPNISFISKFNMPMFKTMMAYSSSDSNRNKNAVIVNNDKTITNRVRTTNTKSIDFVVNNNIVRNNNNILTLLSNHDQDFGGIELGIWKFLGTLLNIYGLSLTSAGHGSFLIQLTTLFVPLAQGIMGVPIPKQIWIAISLALSGVLLFTSADMNMSESMLSSSSSLYGDIACIGAAFMYATYDLRLYHYGKHIEPLKLITGKIITQTSLSIIALLLFAFNESYDFILSSITSVNNQHDNILLLFVIIWSGFIVNTIAPYLQVSGQQAIGPARAQIIYATQPLWASIMSYVFLHEVMSQQGMIGSTLFLAAVLLASTAPPVEPQEVVAAPDDYKQKNI